MNKENNSMKSEEKKKQEQLNTEKTREQQTDNTKEKKVESNQPDNEQTQEKDVKEEEKKSTAGKKEQSEEEGKKEEADKKDKARKEKKKDAEQKEKSDTEKLAELQDKYLRLTAEYDNYRKRTLKEKMDLTKSAGQDVLSGLLPVMDDFERALQSIDDAGDIQAVKDGVHLIYNKFNEFLKQQGVKEIEAKDAEFDTDKHEAVSKVPAPSEDMKGKVVDVVQKGYYLNDKVLRFAKVVVGD